MGRLTGLWGRRLELEATEAVDFQGRVPEKRELHKYEWWALWGFSQRLSCHEDKGRQKKLLGKNVHFGGETSSGAATGHESSEL